MTTNHQLNDYLHAFLQLQRSEKEKGTVQIYEIIVKANMLRKVP